MLDHSELIDFCISSQQPIDPPFTTYAGVDSSETTQHRPNGSVESIIETHVEDGGGIMRRLIEAVHKDGLPGETQIYEVWERPDDSNPLMRLNRRVITEVFGHYKPHIAEVITEQHGTPFDQDYRVNTTSITGYIHNTDTFDELWQRHIQLQFHRHDAEASSPTLPQDIERRTVSPFVNNAVAKWRTRLVDTVKNRWLERRDQMRAAGTWQSESGADVQPFPRYLLTRKM